MPRKLNNFTIAYEANEVVPKELCYRGGSPAGSALFKELHQLQSRCFHNTWFYIKNDRAVQEIQLNASETEMAPFLTPVINKWGEYAP